MNSGLFFPITSLFFSILLNVVYFTKKRIDNFNHIKTCAFFNNKKQKTTKLLILKNKMSNFVVFCLGAYFKNPLK